MSQVPYDLNGGQPLPPQGEWRLAPFAYRRSRMEVLGLLSRTPEPNESPDESRGGEGHVFRVRVDGHGEYALKVVSPLDQTRPETEAEGKQFRFWTTEKLRVYQYPLHNKPIDDATLTFHSDPFFAECRAYGRIRSIEQTLAKKSKAKSPPRVAVPCFGYLPLPAVEYEALFKDRFQITDWDRAPKQKGAPFRAIVKQLVVGKRAVFNPPKMKRDLKALLAAGLIQGDVRLPNYVGGLLVDFGYALTEPHWAVEQHRPVSVQGMKENDQYCLDQILKEERPNSLSRCFPNPSYINKLRSFSVLD